MNCVVENFNTLLICTLTFCMFLIARYGNSEYVDERHRHRYEVNPDVIETLEEAGLKFVGKDESGKRMEILELPSHPFYVGAQFHPEFKSRPARPSALFLGLILAATGKLEAYISSRQNGS
uniref:CTP synthase (glutamine hydrolyzing) n=1 Tax=Glycine max TaxID=3847 RepID=C6T0V3_SOYBN|nr:unknown [Glycine max]|eukprot:NP_001238142.1 uncharacterized protein LOC100500185 [Glycine max]